LELRWLPFFHLILALCAAEVLQLRPRSPTAAASVLLLIAVTIPMSIFQTQGDYGATVMLIYFQIAVVWLLGDGLSAAKTCTRWRRRSLRSRLLLATYLSIPAELRRAEINLGQELQNPSHSIRSAVFECLSCAGRLLQTGKEIAAVGRTRKAGSTSMWPVCISGTATVRFCRPAWRANLISNPRRDPISTKPKYSRLAPIEANGLFEQIGIDGLTLRGIRELIPRLALIGNSLLQTKKPRLSSNRRAVRAHPLRDWRSIPSRSAICSGDDFKKLTIRETGSRRCRCSSAGSPRF